MDIYKILKEMNKEIVEMQDLIYNGAWCFELEEYLLNRGFEKIQEYDTIRYKRGEVYIGLFNDLEVYIGDYYNSFIIIEQDFNDRKKVQVKFEKKSF